MVEVQNAELLIWVALLSPDMGHSILGIYTATAAFGSLTMAELICIKLNCVSEISFSPRIGLPGTRKTESTHYTATSPGVLIFKFVLNKKKQILNEVITNMKQIAEFSYADEVPRLSIK
jgi:hypothetical protein